MGTMETWMPAPEQLPSWALQAQVWPSLTLNLRVVPSSYSRVMSFCSRESSS